MEEDEENCDETDPDRIPVEIFCKAAADTANHPVLSGTEDTRLFLLFLACGTFCGIFLFLFLASHFLASLFIHLHHQGSRYLNRVGRIPPGSRAQR
jgi:hypothetical protein